MVLIFTEQNKNLHKGGQRYNKMTILINNDKSSGNGNDLINSNNSSSCNNIITTAATTPKDDDGNIIVSSSSLPSSSSSSSSSSTFNNNSSTITTFSITCSSSNKSKPNKSSSYSYVLTGIVANARLSPLLPADWIDVTSSPSPSLSLSSLSINNNTIINKKYDKVDKKKKNDDDKNENEHQKQIIVQQQEVVGQVVKHNNVVQIPIHFLWENSPRYNTKFIRDHVRVYSHLPNGINILDSKWVLGRIFQDMTAMNHEKIDHAPEHDHDSSLVAVCETYCFCGVDGFRDFAKSVELLRDNDDDRDTQPQDNNSNNEELEKMIQKLPDVSALEITKKKQENGFDDSDNVIDTTIIERPSTKIMNWWVVKDAGANGAGGVWVVSPENVHTFLDDDTSTNTITTRASSSRPLLCQEHKYVAQQYVWPPILYEQKKCHVRVYVTITYNGQAYIHRRAFLHVANNKFTVVPPKTNSTTSNGKGAPTASGVAAVPVFDDCIHITNCCANSHDDTKFAGEILADFCETTWKKNKNGGNGGEQNEEQPIVPLGEFYPSVKATVTAYVKKVFKLGLIDGGKSNNGFEYCGMDFMLSYKKMKKANTSGAEKIQPVAYLLEINSPPSQDTASSLPHAEALHNEVLQDWMNYWVIPKIDNSKQPKIGRWQHCCGDSNYDYNDGNNDNDSDHDDETTRTTTTVPPSKAAILNKIRYTLFERKLQKQEQQQKERRDANNTAATAVAIIIKDDDNDVNIDKNITVTQKQQQQQQQQQITLQQVKDYDHDDDYDDGKEMTLQQHFLIVPKSSNIINNGHYINNHNETRNKVIIMHKISSFVRSHFPFFSSSSSFSCSTNTDCNNVTNNNDNNMNDNNNTKSKKQLIFFENAGGTQVPKYVIDYVTASLTRRHREGIGAETKEVARETIRRLLVGDTNAATATTSAVVDVYTNNSTSSGSGGEEKKKKGTTPTKCHDDAQQEEEQQQKQKFPAVIFGFNTTSLLQVLAQRYGQIVLSSTDEVVISTENHVANFDPWLVAAKASGATIKLWTPFRSNNSRNGTTAHCKTSSDLKELITPKTRLVAIPHASNVLGIVRPISAMSKMIKDQSHGYAHIVVDGVAAAPHLFVGLDENFGGNVDWYVVSLHKLFGPHLGCLLAHSGSRSVEEFLDKAVAKKKNTAVAPKSIDADVDTSSLRFTRTIPKQERLQSLLESGTVNIESCAGIIGLGMYFKLLSRWYQKEINNTEVSKKIERMSNIVVSTKIIELANTYDDDNEDSTALVSTGEVKLAYTLIRKVEQSLFQTLWHRLSRYSLVRIIDGSNNITIDHYSNDDNNDDSGNGNDVLHPHPLHLPTISFVHKMITSNDIYNYCYDRDIICRHGFFLCTNYMVTDLNLSSKFADGVLRVSLAHYNTIEEVTTLCNTLECIPNWDVQKATQLTRL